MGLTHFPFLLCRAQRNETGRERSRIWFEGMGPRGEKVSGCCLQCESVPEESEGFPEHAATEWIGSVCLQPFRIKCSLAETQTLKTKLIVGDKRHAKQAGVYTVSLFDGFDTAAKFTLKHSPYLALAVMHELVACQKTHYSRVTPMTLRIIKPLAAVYG